MIFNENAIVELGRSPAVREITDDAAGRVLRAAQSGAPVDTGDYLAGLAVEDRDTPYRAVRVVVGRDPKTMLIESKTGNLQKALRSASNG